MSTRKKTIIFAISLFCLFTTFMTPLITMRLPLSFHEEATIVYFVYFFIILLLLGCVWSMIGDEKLWEIKK